MKTKICLTAVAAVLAITGASSAALAGRTTEGWNAFRAGIAGTNQSCVQETWGATANNCTTSQAELFETVIDHTGLKTITAYVYAPGTAVSCMAQAFDTDTIDHRVDGASVSSPASGYAAVTFQVTVPVGWNMRASCDVPVGGKVLALSFNP